MTQRQNTKNPCPSNALADLNDNTIIIDEWVNSENDYTIDRFGNQFQTKHKILNDLKKSIEEIENKSFLPMSGGTVSGTLNAKTLKENDVRVYSPNNKPTADDIGSIPAIKKEVNGVPIYMVGCHLVCSDWVGKWDLNPFRRNELPFGWYFMNGDNYLLSSPQGQALNSLSANYKKDHRITIKTINGLQYINVPTAFAPDGRGCFIRAVDGTTRQVGSIEGDAIRNITARFGNILASKLDASGAFRVDAVASPAYGGNSSGWHTAVSFDASLAAPTANENRSINIGMTPAIYLGV